MDIAAPHVGFVLAAYGISAITLLAVCVYVMRRDRATRKQLQRDD